MEDFSNVPEIRLIFPRHQNVRKRIKVPTSREAIQILRSAWDVNKMEVVEQVRLLYLDEKVRCIGQALLATGTEDSCKVNSRMVLASAMKADASHIVIAHNHPKGTPFPSVADIKLTLRLAEATRFMDVGFLDHIILTKNSHFSFKDEGLIPR